MAKTRKFFYKAQAKKQLKKRRLKLSKYRKIRKLRNLQ